MKKTFKILSVLLSCIVLSSATAVFNIGVQGAEASGKREITGTGVYWYSDTLTSGYASGTGKENDPYIIKTAAQLRFAVMGSTKTGVYYKLGNDIAINDTSDSEWYKGENLKNWIKGSYGNEFYTDAQNKLEMSGDQFRNTFDGAGHTVSGLYIDYTGTGIAGSSNYGWGLFPYVNGATIKNLKLTDVYIKSDITDGTDDKKHGYGALIGATYTRGATVNNVLVKNVVFELNRVSKLTYTSTTSSVNIGGIVGLAGGKIVISDSVVNNVRSTLTNGYSSSKQPCNIGSIIGLVGAGQQYTFTNIISYGNMNPFTNGADDDSVICVTPPKVFVTDSRSSISNVWAIGNVSIPKAINTTVKSVESEKEFEIGQGDFLSALGTTSDLWLTLKKCKLPMLKSYENEQITAHRSFVPATCTKKAKCEYCGEILSNEPDIHNHTGSMVTKDKKPYTCDMIGYEGTVYCSDCGKPVSYGESIDAIGHNYGEWTVKTSAAIGKDGLRVRTCKTCGYVDEEIIPQIIKINELLDNKTKNPSNQGKKQIKSGVSSETTEETSASYQDDDKETVIIRKMATNKSDNSVVWLYVIIAAGVLVVIATVVSSIFLLKKSK